MAPSNKSRDLADIARAKSYKFDPLKRISKETNVQEEPVDAPRYQDETKLRERWANTDKLQIALIEQNVASKYQEGYFKNTPGQTNIRHTDLISKEAQKQGKSSPKEKETKGEGLRIREILAAQRPCDETRQPKEEMVSDESQEVYDKLFEFVKVVMEAARGKKEFSLEDGFRLVSKVIEDHIIDSLYIKTLAYREHEDVLASHSVNVFVYAIKLGLGLKYTRHQLIELGLASLVHDIGMTSIPEEIIKKANPLDKKEFNIIKTHPLEGYGIISSLGKEYNWLAEVILQEHEREQGQGYPKGIKGDEIHEYAKIIGIADVYETLTHPRPHRNGCLPYEAMKEMMGSQRVLFSPKILKTLLSQLTMYPPCSYVKLNSNVIGRVIQVHSDRPFRPTIEVWYDSQGRPLEKRQIINLSEEPFLHITECLHEEDLLLE